MSNSPTPEDIAKLHDYCAEHAQHLIKLLCKAGFQAANAKDVTQTITYLVQTLISVALAEREAEGR
jgi:hypothetical protein